jgi:hypothetical protein
MARLVSTDPFEQRTPPQGSAAPERWKFGVARRPSEQQTSGSGERGSVDPRQAVITKAEITGAIASRPLPAVASSPGEATVVQAKLAVAAPEDPAEIEADAAAEAALQGRRAVIGAAGGILPIRRYPDDTVGSPSGWPVRDDNLIVPAKQSSPVSRAPTPGFERTLATTEGLGKPLPAATRRQLEPSFGHSFAAVRVHDGPAASELANSIGALAFARGTDVYFARGLYAPHTTAGARLLAHELAHVVQQGRSRNIVQRQPAPQPDPADKSYKFRIKVTKKESGAEFIVTAYVQIFGVTPAVAADLLQRHPGHWAGGSGKTTDADVRAGSRWISIEASLYDAIRDDLRAGSPGGKGLRMRKPPPPDAPARAKEAAARAAEFDKLPKTEQQKIDQEAAKEFEAKAGHKPPKLTDKTDGSDAELQRKIRDELLRIRALLGALPASVRDAVGDPAKYSPAQYEQLLRIGNKLAGLSNDDLLLYRIIVSGITTDLAAVEQSLDRFIKFKAEYQKALEQQARTQQQQGGTPEPTLEQQLDQAYAGFDKSKFSTLSQSDKTAAAREIAYARAGTQLKYMVKHPGQTAVGMVKGLNPAEVMNGIERDIREFKDSSSSWGKWAAGTGISSKVAGWIAGVAAVAWVVMWFIPGVNLVNAMATAASIALYAGLAAVLLSSASQELHIRAAGAAKTEQEFETETNAAGDELTSAVFGLVLLVGGLALKLLGKAKFAQRYLNVGRTLNDLKVKAYAAVGIDALKALRRDALAAIQRELAGLDADFKIAQNEHAALRKQIEGLSPHDLLRKIGNDAAFAARLGLDAKQAATFRAAADGPVGAEGGQQAKAKILQAMDDGAAEARGSVDRLKTDVQKITDDLNAAQDHTSFDQALDRAAKAMSPEEQARVTDEARTKYQQRAMQAAMDEMQAAADRVRAAEADTVQGRQPQNAQPAQPPATPTGTAPATELGEANLRAQGYTVDRIFMDSVPGPIPAEGWKLHVTATPANAEAVASAVLPKLRSMGVNHKVVVTAEALRTTMTGGQTGKFITIYPGTPAHAVAIVKAIDAALAGKGLSGPPVAGEVPVGTSGSVYSRYGGFTKSTVTNPAGVEVEDVRGQAHPDWIDDIWNKQPARPDLKTMAPPRKAPPIPPTPGKKPVE